MKKLHLFKTVLLLCALIVGSGSVWAADVTISVGSSNLTWTADGNDYKATSGDFNLRYEKGGYSNSISGGIQSKELRLYSGTNFVISSSYTITQIVYTVADGTGKNYSVAALSTKDGNLTDGTWTGSATSVSASLSAQNRIKSVTITYSTGGGSPLASIALSGDYPTEFTEGDEFSSEGLVVTATYEDESESVVTPTSITGYDMSTLDESQTVTVSYTESEVTKTATYTIIVRSIPTHTLSSAVSPAGAGSVELSATSVKEGATATATATANAGFKFTGWSIDDDDNGAELSSTSDNPTTVTMGEANATITATFEAVTTYAIQWSVNGEVQRTDNVEEDAAVSFPASISGIPAGYTLMGWSETEVNTPQDDAPSMVSSATSTADKTYYAVMAVQIGSGSDTYEKLASNSFDSNATYVIAGKQSANDATIWYLKSYANTDTNSDWGVATSSPATETPVTFQLSGTAGELIAKDNSGNYLTCYSVKKFGMSSTSTAVYIDSDGSIKSASDGNYLRYNYNTGNGGFRWYNGTTTGQQAYFYKVIAGATYSNYCTTVPSISVTVTSAKYATFSDNVARDFSESGITVYTALAGTNKVTLTEVEDGIVPANTGVVLYSASAVTKSIPAVATEKTELEDNEMVANVARTQIAADGGEGKTNYILANEDSGLGFYLASESGAYLNANRAYLSTATAGEAREFLGFDDEGETTGIANANVNLNANENYYNLNGQRVAQPTKGLYIVNGKKYIVK